MASSSRLAFPFSSSSSSLCSLPPPPATAEERIDQILDRISPTEETDAARAEVFAFLRSVIDRCFSECKVKKNKSGADGRKKKAIDPSLS